MSGRPGWDDQYWKRMDKETARRLRSACPRCGSSQTYYNERFHSWRCGRCEHSFVVKGLGARPWWKRLLGRK